MIVYKKAYCISRTGRETTMMAS